MGRRSDHTREELYAMALATARGIVEAEGLRGLTARRVAREIGYSIGTIYNLFENLDDLIVRLNETTLDGLYEAITKEAVPNEPEAALRAYARHYIAFTSENARLWSAILEYQRPDHVAVSESYTRKVQQLLSLLETALAPFFEPGEEAERLHDARVLWGSVHGICSLAQSDSLAPTESPMALADTLISRYVAGLETRRRA